MPKLESPFLREETKQGFVCVPKINEEYRWAFSDEADAVEKLDGTNVSIMMKDHTILGIYNRKNPIGMWKKGNRRFVEGVLNAIEREAINPDSMEDGQYFGELIGPMVNGNPYKLREHLWLPLSSLRSGYRYKFWDKLVPEFKGIGDSEIFDKASTTFMGLWSLYKRKHFKGTEFAEPTKDTPFSGFAAEGIVFYNRSTGRMCKLRRDMFPWFTGERHAQ
jgi:hypothetical protein